MDHSIVLPLPLPLGLAEVSEKQSMETEGGEAVAGSIPERGKKRPPSPSILGDDEDSSKSATDDEDGDWSVSDSEEEDDYKDEGPFNPYTIDDIPRPSCGYDDQCNVVDQSPQLELRGPSPIWLFPPCKSGKNPFRSDYNLDDKSEISVINVEDCLEDCHCSSMILLQFIDIRIVGYRHTSPGRAKIFGFIAAREIKEPLRNYVYNIDIEKCEDVYVRRRTGVARLSLASPARVISMPIRTLIEFELHDQSEDETNGDDGLIIEGCTELNNMFATQSFIETRRLYSNKCALDIKFAVLMFAVEARVSIKPLRVPTCGVYVDLRAKTSGFSDVIRLFQGSVSEVDPIMTFPVAVSLGKKLYIRLEGLARDNSVLGQEADTSNEWKCGFRSQFHGKNELEAKLGDFAAFSVIITWRCYQKT